MKKYIILFLIIFTTQAAEAGMFYSYKKKTDQFTTYELVQPDYAQLPKDMATITELCTIDGLTYVSIPDGMVLPGQPVQVQKTLKEITLTPELKAKIRQTSPHVKLLERRIAQNADENVRLSKQDELNMECLKNFLPSPSLGAAYIEECRKWEKKVQAIPIGEIPKL